MYELIYANIIVFLASILQTTTGFGFAIMATPLLLILFNSGDCIQISLIISSFIAIALISKIRHEININILKRFTIGGIFGIPIGLLIFVYSSIEILKIIVSVIILTITAVMLYINYRNKNQNNPEPISSMKVKTPIDNYPVLNESNTKNELLVGLAAGALTTSVGMPGVPPAIYFITTNTKKEVTRSTTLAFFIVLFVFSVLTQLFTLGISYDVMTYSLLLCPAAAIGIIIGNMLFKRINQKTFLLIANTVLIFTGIYMLIQSV